MKFDEELEDAKEPVQVDPVNILDDPELMCQTRSNIPRPPKPNDERTRKHKTKWHDTTEASQDQVDQLDNNISEVPKPTIPPKRTQPKHSCRKAHLLTTAAFLSLANNASGLHMLDTGDPLTQLGQSKLQEHNPFDPSSAYHILETDVNTTSPEVTLSHAALA